MQIFPTRSPGLGCPNLDCQRFEVPVASGATHCPVCSSALVELDPVIRVPALGLSLLAVVLIAWGALVWLQRAPEPSDRARMLTKFPTAQGLVQQAKGPQALQQRARPDSAQTHVLPPAEPAPSPPTH